VSGSHDQESENPLDAARQLLLQELDKVREDKKTYPELAEREQRVATALAALDGGKPLKKRLRWEQIAEYLAKHPASKAGEIAAALEAPLQNVYAHLARNEGTVFVRADDGWETIGGWEKHRRDTGSR
jgi:predicted ArsR family transcriptional regulator